jgi:hypothetical protein
LGPGRSPTLNLKAASAHVYKISAEKKLKHEMSEWKNLVTVKNGSKILGGLYSIARPSRSG